MDGREGARNAGRADGRHEDERLFSLRSRRRRPAAGADPDTWRVLRIFGRVRRGLDTNGRAPARGDDVSGTARITPEDPMYGAATPDGPTSVEGGLRR